MGETEGEMEREIEGLWLRVMEGWWVSVMEGCWVSVMEGWWVRGRERRWVRGREGGGEGRAPLCGRVPSPCSFLASEKILEGRRTSHLDLFFVLSPNPAMGFFLLEQLQCF